MRTTTSPTRSSRPSRLPSLKVLGIDPGLAATGYAVITPSPGRAVVVDSGVIGTASDLPLEARLSTIYDVVDRLLVSHAPSVLVLEDVYTACRFPRAALLMAHARGVVCLAARQHEEIGRASCRERVEISVVQVGGEQRESEVCGPAV